jgi:hypothetical protein
LVLGTQYASLPTQSDAGFFDSDGSVSMNLAKFSMVLLLLKNIKIYFKFYRKFIKIIYHDKKMNTFRWVVSKKKNEVLNLQQLYFSNYQLKSKKND